MVIFMRREIWDPSEWNIICIWLNGNNQCTTTPQHLWYCDFAYQVLDTVKKEHKNLYIILNMSYNFLKRYLINKATKCPYKIFLSYKAPISNQWQTLMHKMDTWSTAGGMW